MSLPLFSHFNQLKFIQYIPPKQGPLDQGERLMVIQYQASMGNNWVNMTNLIPGRTALQLKNFWHSEIRKATPFRYYQHQPNGEQTLLDILCEVALEDVSVNTSFNLNN